MACLAILLCLSLLVACPVVSKRIRIHDALKGAAEQIDAIQAANLAEAAISKAAGESGAEKAAAAHAPTEKAAAEAAAANEAAREKAAAEVETATEKEAAVEKTVPCCGSRKEAQNGAAKTGSANKGSAETAAVMSPHGDPLWNEVHHSKMPKINETVAVMKSATHGDPLFAEAQENHALMAQRAKEKVAAEVAAAEMAAAPEPSAQPDTGFAARIGARFRAVGTGLGFTRKPSADSIAESEEDATNADTSAESQEDATNADTSAESEEYAADVDTSAESPQDAANADASAEAQEDATNADASAEPQEAATNDDAIAESEEETADAYGSAESEEDAADEAEDTASEWADIEEAAALVGHRPRRPSWAQIKLDTDDQDVLGKNPKQTWAEKAAAEEAAEPSAQPAAESRGEPSAKLGAEYSDAAATQEAATEETAAPAGRRPRIKRRPSWAEIKLDEDQAALGFLAHVKLPVAEAVAQAAPEAFDQTWRHQIRAPSGSMVARAASNLERSMKDKYANPWLRQRLLDQSDVPKAALLAKAVDQLLADRQGLLAARNGLVEDKDSAEKLIREVSENAEAATMADAEAASKDAEEEKGKVAGVLSELMKEKAEATAKAIAETESELSSNAIAISLAAEKATADRAAQEQIDAETKKSEAEATARAIAETKDELSSEAIAISTAAEEASADRAAQEKSKAALAAHRLHQAHAAFANSAKKQYAPVLQRLPGGVSEAAGVEERKKSKAAAEAAEAAASESGSSDQTRSEVSRSTVRERVEEFEQRGKGLEDSLWRAKLEEMGTGYVVSLHPEELARGVDWDEVQSQDMDWEPQEAVEAVAASAAFSTAEVFSDEDEEAVITRLRELRCGEQAAAESARAQGNPVQATPVSSDPNHIEVRLVGTHLHDGKRKYSFELLNGEWGYIFSSRFSHLRNSLKPIFGDFPSDQWFVDFIKDADNAAQRGEDMRNFLEQQLNRPDMGEALTLPQVHAAFQMTPECEGAKAALLRVAEARKAKFVADAAALFEGAAADEAASKQAAAEKQKAEVTEDVAIRHM